MLQSLRNTKRYNTENPPSRACPALFGGFFQKMAVGNLWLPKCKPHAVSIYRALTYFGGTEDEIG